MNPIIIRYKALKGGNFSIDLDYTLEGIRRYEFLKLRVSKDYSKNKGVVEKDKDILSLAETIRAKRQSELYHKTSFDTSVKQLNRLLFDYVEEYYVQTKRHRYKYLLKYLKGFSKKPILLSDVTPLFITRLTDYLSKQMARNSVITYMGTFNMFMSKAVKEGLLSDNPCHKLKPLTYVQSDRTFLTLGELKKLLASPCLNNEQVEQAFLFSCFTGLRISDIYLLKWEEIVCRNDKYHLSLTPFKTSNTSGVKLNTPLSHAAVAILEQVKGERSGRVFTNLPCKSQTNTLLKWWAALAKVNYKLHFNMGRHTYATLAVTYGMDIYVISKSLGHASVSTTSIYAKLMDEKKQEEIAKLPIL